jgi:AraC-like DNA-binding protein
VDVSDGLRGTLSGYEMSVLNRALVDLIQRCRVAGIAVPAPVFDHAVEINRAVNGSAPEQQNRRARRDVPVSSEPVQTLTVRDTARAMEVSESYVRRLIRERTLDVRDSPGPYRVYADSLAVWREQRERRMEDERRAALNGDAIATGSEGSGGAPRPDAAEPGAGRDPQERG